MGRHSKDASRFYRGKHRAPTTTGRNIARVATAGAVAAAPMGVFVTSASAAEGFDRDAIIACESGGDARAQNSSSTASGLYQFINGTWKAYGGSTARAKDASVAEQHRVAARLFAAEGYSPWNASKSCWSGKIGSGESVKITGGSEAKAVAKSKPVTKQQRVAQKQVAPKQQVAPKRVAPKQVAKRAEVQSKGVVTHKVQSGETLSEITLERTGSSDWSKMYAENRGVIGGNPHLIVPGQRLTVVK